MRIRSIIDADYLPALDPAFALNRPASGLAPDSPPLRILLLYGSLRPRSFPVYALKKRRAYCSFLALKPEFLIPRICPCRTRWKMMITPR